MKSSGLIFNVSLVKDDVIHEMDCWPIPGTWQEHGSRTYFQIRLCRACWPTRAFIMEMGIGKKTNVHRVLHVLGPGLTLSCSSFAYYYPHVPGEPCVSGHFHDSLQVN